MRIRKNQNLFATIREESGIKNLTAYMCQLNQTPWDVMSFTDEEYQNEYNLNEKESLGGSISAVKSITMGGGKEMKAKQMRSKDNDVEIIEDNSEIRKIICKQKRFNEKEEARIEGGLKFQRGWDCKNHAPKEAHLETLLETHNNINEDKRNYDDLSNIRELESTIIIGSSSSQARTKRKSYSQQASSSANNDRFYYYWWFGPRWGKRRGDRIEENTSTEWKDNGGVVGTARNAIPTSDSESD